MLDVESVVYQLGAVRQQLQTANPLLRIICVELPTDARQELVSVDQCGLNLSRILLENSLDDLES